MGKNHVLFLLFLFLVLVCDLVYPSKLKPPTPYDTGELILLVKERARNYKVPVNTYLESHFSNDFFMHKYMLDNFNMNVNLSKSYLKNLIEKEEFQLRQNLTILIIVGTMFFIFIVILILLDLVGVL